MVTGKNLILGIIMLPTLPRRNKTKKIQNELKDISILNIWRLSKHCFFFNYLKTNHSICGYFNICLSTYVRIYPVLLGISDIRFDHKVFNETILLNKIESIVTDEVMASNKSVFMIYFGLHVVMNLSFNEASKLSLNFIKLTNNLSNN